MTTPLLIITIWGGLALLSAVLYMMVGKRIGIPKVQRIDFARDMTELQRIDKVQEEVAAIEKIGYISGQYLSFPDRPNMYLCDCSSEDLMKADALYIDYFHTKQD